MTLSKAKRITGSCLMCFSLSFAFGRAQYPSAHEVDPVGIPEQDTEKQNQEKKVYTNEDLDRSEVKSHRNDVESTPPHEESKGSKGTRSAPKGSESGTALTRYRDLNGHNREYWQKRIRPLKIKLDRLDSQIQSLQDQQGANARLRGIKVSRKGRWRAPSQDSGSSSARKIENLKQKRAEVAKSIQEVEEEARTAQALPEWLR